MDCLSNVYFQTEVVQQSIFRLEVCYFASGTHVPYAAMAS